jgi:hypothetical protein
MLFSYNAIDYTIEVWMGSRDLPAAFVDRFDACNEHPGAGAMTVVVNHRDRGPRVRLAVHGSSFEHTWQPLALHFAPETAILFAGAGKVAVAIDVNSGTRLWTESDQTLIWTWLRAGDVMVLVDELELTAYDLHASMLWRTYIEPPHDVRVVGDDLQVSADQLGAIRNYQGSFKARNGP